MTKEIDCDMVRVIVLDISGVYVQIHEQGYFDVKAVKNILKQYSDAEHWHILIIE